MLARWLCSFSLRSQTSLRLTKPFSALTAHNSKPLPPRPTIPESDITESFLKGTGPGGQKINKTSSAVQLKHLPTGLVVKCQGTRSREQNRRTARKLLGEKLEELEKGDQARTVLKRVEKGKRKASAEKKRRRKYRRLEEERGKGGEGESEVEDGGEEDALAEREGRDMKAVDSGDAQEGSDEQRRPP